MPHEHLLVDLSCRRWEATDPYLRSIAEKPVDCTVVSDLYYNPMISKDSLRLTDVDLAIQELEYFKAAGGQSVVEQSSQSIGGDPVALKRISEGTGINIVATTGYYSPVLPEDIDDLSIDQLADRLIEEVTEGFEGTDIRAGIIGEIGTSWPLTWSEAKTLRAAARAQRSTGAALSIHPSPWDRHALELVDIVEAEGVNPYRIVICHLDLL